MNNSKKKLSTESNPKTSVKPGPDLSKMIKVEITPTLSVYAKHERDVARVKAKHLSNLSNMRNGSYSLPKTVF